MDIPFRWRFWHAGLCGQRRQRIRKVCLRDLLKRLVDRDGLGWPSRVHDEHDGSGAAANRIAAIAFAYGDYSFIVSCALASASSFSSWLTRSSNANKRELNIPTLKNVTLLAGASRVLP